MKVSFRPLSGLSKWLIFWLKMYVLVSLLAVPTSLWTTYSMQRTLAEYESSERELGELLESEGAADEADILFDGEVHNDALVTSQSLAPGGIDAEVPKEQPDFVMEPNRDFFLVSQESGSGPQTQSGLIAPATSKEEDGVGDLDDLTFEPIDFNTDELLANQFSLTVWDYVELFYDFALLIAFLISYTLSGIVFLKWVYRTNRNLGLFASTKPENSPSWAAWSFLIPLVNIFTPPKIMQELYTISSGGARSSIVGGWWSLVIIDYFVTKASVKMAAKSVNNPLAFLGSYESLVIDLLSSFMGAALGYATLRLVQQISAAYDTNIRESLEEASQSTPELA